MLIPKMSQEINNRRNNDPADIPMHANLLTTHAVCKFVSSCAVLLLEEGQVFVHIICFGISNFR